MGMIFALVMIAFCLAYFRRHPLGTYSRPARSVRRTR